MRISVCVTLDDGTEVTKTIDVDSSDNPSFWTHGVDYGMRRVVQDIQKMVEGQYGRSNYEGVHTLTPVSGYVTLRKL